MPRSIADANSITYILDRYWSKVNVTESCWVWTSATNDRGYGKFSLGGRQGKAEKAHRISYWLHYGVWPHTNVLHKCDNPPCVRPDHLYLGSIRDNSRDMMQRGRGGGQFVKGHTRGGRPKREELALASA